MRGIYSVLIVNLILLSFLLQSAAASNQPTIDLTLFGKNVVGDYRGCRFALWPSSDGTESDQSQYIFFAPFNDGELLPGWIQINNRVIELERKGSHENTDLYAKHQLYVSHDGDVSLIMEIKSLSTEGDLDFISDASVTIVMKDRLPKEINNLEGHIFCPQNYSVQFDSHLNQGTTLTGKLFGDQISLYEQQDFNGIEFIPSSILKNIKSDFDVCDLDSVQGYLSSYKISEAMTLWEIPCAVYARNTSTLLVVSLNINPNHFSVLSTTAIPDLNLNSRVDLLNASIEPQTATVTSFNLSTQNDCGTYEVHQLRAVEGEAIELALVEFREKSDCDGVETDPNAYPLVYIAN